MDNGRRFYTYAYLREDGTPYYIGKGTGNRAFVKKNRRVPTPTKDRILFLKTGLTEEEAFRHEVYLVAVLGRKDLGTGILWNFTDGGEGKSGWVTPEETKQKQSQALKGKPSWNKGGEAPWMREWERTDDYRSKMSQIMKSSGRVKEVQALGAMARKRPIVGINPRGDKVLFESAHEAHRVTGVSRGNISSCCLGQRKTAGNWQWFFSD